MIRRLLPLLLLCCIAGQASATIGLNETHGSSWVTWDWNVTALEENQVLIGRYDGREVVNQTANTTPPLLTSYAVTGIGASEPHSFELVLLNTSAEPATVEEIQSSTVTTGRAGGDYLLFLGIAGALCLIGILFGRVNRIATLFVFTVAFLIGAYVMAATVVTDMVVFGFGLIVVIVALICLVFTFLDLVRESRGWGGDD